MSLTISQDTVQSVMFFFFSWRMAEKKKPFIIQNDLSLQRPSADQAEGLELDHVAVAATAPIARGEGVAGERIAPGPRIEITAQRRCAVPARRCVAHALPVIADDGRAIRGGWLV